MIILKKIVNLQEYQYENSFKKEVLPFFKKINFPFQYHKAEKEAVFILKDESYLIIFIEFVPPSVYTDYPSLEESLHGIDTYPRTSTGEWVVNFICEMDTKYQSQLYQMIENHKDNVPSYLKRRLTKSRRDF